MIPPVSGFRWGGIEAGIRKRPGRPDLALLIADEPVACSGIFTRSDMAAAPVRLSRRVASSGRARAVLMNAGCANACTGAEGEAAASRMAASLGISPSEVLIASTGVIGAQLPVEKIEANTAKLIASARPDGIQNFAQSIMTTDTREKIAWRQGEVGGKFVTVAGVCKGAGMIMPDMATMLACVVTDAAISPKALQVYLGEAGYESFNAVTVDGDTSTNDSLFLLASGKAGNASEKYDHKFDELLRQTCVDLAKQIAADGEGATKFIEVRIREARDSHEADVIGRRIANSPLVKTALHAADANWGRIMAAIGVSGFGVDASRVSIAVDDCKIVEHGVGLGSGAEQRASEIMKGKSFALNVGLGRGGFGRTIYTCDFSAEYVKINAEYRS